MAFFSSAGPSTVQTTTLQPTPIIPERHNGSQVIRAVFSRPDILQVHLYGSMEIVRSPHHLCIISCSEFDIQAVLERQLEALRHFFMRRMLDGKHHRFPPSIRRILEELSESLDETYRRISRWIGT